MKNRDPHHISWKNHNIDTYIELSLQQYLRKKMQKIEQKLKCSECGAIEMNAKYANQACVWCPNGVMKSET